MNDIKLKLKEIREMHGFTQREVADAIGISYASYNLYEKHKRTPNIEVLMKLCNFFDCNIEYLYDLDNNFSIPASPEEIKRNRQNTTMMRQLCSYYYELNDLGRKKAIERIAELTEIKKYTEFPDFYCEDDIVNE